MRRFKNIYVALLILIFLTSCANFNTNTKNAIGSAGITYNQSMQAAADLKKQGKISDTQWIQIDKYGKAFYVAYNSTIDAFIIYLKAENADAKAKVEILLVNMATELTKINDYINVLKGGSK